MARLQLGQTLHDCLTIGAHWSRLIANVQSAWSNLQLEHDDEAAAHLRQAGDAWKILHDTFYPYLKPQQREFIDPLHLWMTKIIDHTQLKISEGSPKEWVKKTLRELLQKINERGAGSIEDLIYELCKQTGGGA